MKFATAILAAVFSAGVLGAVVQREVGPAKVVTETAAAATPSQDLVTFLDAFCSMDAERLLPHLTPGMASREDIEASRDAAVARGQTCVGWRYLGSLRNADGEQQYVWVLDLPAGQTWYVGTFVEGLLTDLD